MEKDMESLEEKLAQTDFSHEGNKLSIKNKMLNNLAKSNSNIGDDNMKFERRFNPKNIAVASLLCVVGFSAVVYGADIIESMREYRLGEHATYIVYHSDINDSDINHGANLFESGNLLENDIYFFDEDGNRLSELTEGVVAYDADGYSYMFSSADTPFDYSKVTLFDSFDDAKQHLAFDLLVPTVLPEGYDIYKIYMFNDEHGNIPEKETNYYLSYELRNNEGNRIPVNVRLMNEDTSFTTGGTSNIEEININGHSGFLDDGILNVYIDEVLYSFIAIGTNVGDEELIEMAKSLI